MKNRWITVTFVFSLAMNAAVLAIAAYGYYNTSSRTTPAAGHLLDGEHHFYQKLGLTPVQLTKIAPLAAAFHQRLESLHSEMELKKDAMISLLGVEDVAQDRIGVLRQEMAAIQDGTQKLVIAHVLDVKAILDAGQKKHFLNLLHESMTQDRLMFNHTGDK